MFLVNSGILQFFCRAVNFRRQRSAVVAVVKQVLKVKMGKGAGIVVISVTTFCFDRKGCACVWRRWWCGRDGGWESCCGGWLRRGRVWTDGAGRGVGGGGCSCGGRLLLEYTGGCLL
eukprot:COSAG02_NODE_673_length_18630_cov_7.960768_10_plen_117_part_00